MEITAIEAFRADDVPGLCHIVPPSGLKIYHRGPSLESGPKPAVFYFTLSAVDSLNVLPYSQLAEDLTKLGIRLFSFTLPAHGQNTDNTKNMAKWATIMASSNQFEDFFLAAKENVDFLIDKQLVNKEKLASAGLSRGAFVATHFAANHPDIHTILGFSPLTSFNELQDFRDVDIAILNRWNLEALTLKLTHKNIRFYIGNRDTRVGTKACVNLVQNLSECAYANGLRSPQIELTLFPSIGHKGHGTPLKIFQEGAIWLYSKLL